MRIHEEPKLCDIDKGVLAEALHDYADSLAKQNKVPALDGKDEGDKAIILAELRMQADEIRVGKRQVTELSMQPDWVTVTSGEMLWANKYAGKPVYKRAITVATHMQKAFEPLILTQ